MDINQRIKKSFNKIKKLPCWGVDAGQGSMISFEFGEPSLKIREPIKPTKHMQKNIKEILDRRRVTVNGEWFLWIYCCDWIVKENKKIIGDSTTKLRMEKASKFLDGQKLINVIIRPRGCRTVFEFDLGGILETKPYDKISEQWLFYEPDGKVLTLRADKMFSYGHKDTSQENEKWQSIQG